VSDSPVHVIIQKHQYLFIYLQLHFQHPISLSENQVPSCISLSWISEGLPMHLWRLQTPTVEY